MRSKILILAAMLILLFPFVAAETTLKLETLPGRDVFISIWNEGMSGYIEAPTKHQSDIYGMVEHVYEGDTSPFEVLVIVKSQGEQEFREEFGPYTAGGTVDLPRLVPDGWVNPLTQEEDSGEDSDDDSDDDSDGGDEGEDSDDDSDDETPPTNNTNDNQTNTTGNAILGGDSGTIAKIVYYVVGGIFIVGIVAAIVVFLMMRMKGPRAPTYHGMKPVNIGSKPKSPSEDRDLDAIEDEIESVEKQIEMYKKKNRLADAEKRLEEKKKMLEKLKKGEK